MFYEIMNHTNAVHAGNTIRIKAGKGTNLFNNMDEKWKCAEFPFYYTKMKRDFCMRCRVSVDFRYLYDLGALVVFENDDRWIKFAFENADTGISSIVTVVTDRTSDDCNGEPVAGEKVWLQICRQGNVFAMHYSKNKSHWKLARICRLEMSEEVMIGISAQCPLGEGCTADFEELEIGENPYSDIRYLKTEERADIK